MNSRARLFSLALCAAANVSACGRTAAPPTPVAAAAPAPTGTRTVRFTTVEQRAIDGRSAASDSGPMRDARDRTDAINRRVRVLQVTPDHIIAHVGDTMSPYVMLRVSGLDSAGTVIPRVTPLYSSLRRDGAIQPLRDGRWLAAKPGLDTLQVRVMRHDQAVSSDTALVRHVTVEVRP